MTGSLLERPTMTTPAAGCPICGTSSAGPCSGCVAILRARLDEAQWVAQELETAITRQTRLADDGVRRRSAGQPLPYDAAASEAAWVLENVLRFWVRMIGIESQGIGAATCAQWLLMHLPELLRRDDVADAVDEITDAVLTGRRIIDGPAQRLWLGPCGDNDCYTDLHARAGDRTVQCHACGTEHDVAERREANRAEALSRLYTAQEIAAYTETDPTVRAIKPQHIDTWARRGRIIRRGTDTNTGSNLYRLGDALNLAARP